MNSVKYVLVNGHIDKRNSLEDNVDKNILEKLEIMRRNL